MPGLRTDFASPLFRLHCPVFVSCSIKVNLGCQRRTSALRPVSAVDSGVTVSTVGAMANSVSSYTIDNLPYGVISTKDKPKKRCAVAFEDSAIDIDLLYHEGFFSSIAELKDNVFAHVSRSGAVARVSSILPFQGQLECLCSPTNRRPGCLSRSAQIWDRGWQRPESHGTVGQRPESSAYAHTQFLGFLLLT